VKIYGNSTKKLLNKIIENKEINIKVFPLNGEFIKILNSAWSLEIICTHKKLWRDGVNQKIDGININPIKVLSQFNDKLKIVVEGSNTENRFVIIFN